jgi:hypothetical protein
MGEMSAQCPNCGEDVNAFVGQAVWPGDRLTWSKAIACRACGSAIEQDSDGIPPERVRRVLLEEKGTWHLSLVKPSDRRLAVATLRKMFGLDLAAAAALLRSSSFELWRGTQVECSWLAKSMQNRGIETTVQQV